MRPHVPSLQYLPPTLSFTITTTDLRKALCVGTRNFCFLSIYNLEKFSLMTHLRQTLQKIQLVGPELP